MKGLNEINEIFRKYLEGNCTEEELLIFNRFIKQNRNHGAVQQMIAEFAEKVQSDKDINDTPDELSKALFDKIRSGIKIQENVKRHQKHQIRRQRTTWLKVAAVVVWVLAGVLWFTYKSSQPGTDEITFIERNTTRGQKSKVTLADGTVVHLNAESKLSFPEQFGNRREVMLEGEAFFQVTRDEKRPFLVKSGNITTQVLGTSFNVKAFPREDIRVTVASGKVRVESLDTTTLSGTKAAPESIILTPNQQVVYNIADQNMQKLEVSTENFIAWKDNTLKFDNERFEEVVKVLSRWYGVDINVENTLLLHCEITGEYTDKSLTTVLENLEYVLAIEYTYEQGVVVIDGEGCQ